MSQENSLFYTDQVFEKIKVLEKGNKETQFDNCTFKNCDLTQANFSTCNFVNTTFQGCNLSMLKFKNVGFDQVDFVDCKLVGADFTNAKDFLFGVNFEGSILDYVAFMKKKNRKSSFKNCSLKGTDFSEADFSSSTFDNCDFSTAVFDRTVLEGADFSTSYNFIINPEKNQLRKAKFSSSGLAGLIVHYGIIVT